MTLKFPIGKHPGSDYIKVECDICHGQFYRKDVVYVYNKYNFQHGYVVCRKDLDEINEQVLPNKIRESLVPDPKLLRPDREPIYDVNPNDDRLPGPPRLGQAIGHPINDTILLEWQGPEDNGSSVIISYVIARATPQLSPYDIIATTSSPETSYEDTSALLSTEYSYKVAAINGFGQGPYSAEFFWPTFTGQWQDIEYLAIEPNNEILIINGYPLRMNHTELGTV